MATNFPVSLDSLTNPTSSDSLSSPSHSAQHANVNDAVEALQAKVGADSSAVATSLDYKVAQLEAVSHGKILQVVSTTKTDTFTTTSSSYVDITGLSVSITPSATSSKVFLIATFGAIDGAGQNHIQFERNGTAIGNGATAGSRTTAAIAVTEGTTNYPDSAAWTYLDSPASVSALTYQAQAKRTGGTLCINRLGTDSDTADYARTSSTLTAVEVAL